MVLCLLILTGGNKVLAVGVRPLLFDFDVRPGDQLEFEINLMPGQRAEVVDLILYEPV